jgi:tetratricopeptide (TPR) repeat protein
MRPVMRFAYAAPAAVLLMLGACARPYGVVSQGSVAVLDIPVTTTVAEARSQYQLGERLLDLGRPQEAIVHFRGAVQADPTFAYGYLGIANAAASAEEFKTNLDLATKYAEGKSEGERLRIDIIRAILDNDLERRLELSQKLAQTYPNSPRAWLVLGNAQSALNQHVDARDSYRRAIALDRNMFVARVALANSYRLSNPRDLAQAKQQIEAAIASAPDEARGYEILGDVYRGMNQLQQARDAYTRAVQKDATYSVATLKLGHINSFLGNYADARASYDAAIARAKEGQKVTYANYRAFAHVHAGDPRAALDELARIEQSAGQLGIPEHQVAGLRTFTLQNALAIALHYSMTPEAERLVDQLKSVMRSEAARVNDSSFTRQQEAAILFAESQLAARKGDFATAAAKAEEHKRFVEGDRNPRKLEAYHSLLGFIELLKGNHQAAVQRYRQANLADEYVRYQLGLALEGAGAGQTEEARQIFKEVATWNLNSIGFALARKDAQKRARAAKTG